MFGYVRPCKGQLRICEYETYRGVYCGLCKEIGRQYGQAARLFLSNDLTFLALVRMGISPAESVTKPCKCLFHGFQKQFCFYDTPALSYAAGVSMLLWYYKLRDMLSDQEPWYKKLAAAVLYPFAYFAYRKASRLYPEAEEICCKSLWKQSRLEAAKCSGLDEAAAPTAEGMAELLCLDVPSEKGLDRVLYRLGYLLGRYIYLCDAAEDVTEDAKSGSYNPFLTMNAPDGFSAKDALYLTIGEIEKTYALLETERFDTILENILLLGLHQAAEGIFLLKERKP